MSKVYGYAVIDKDGVPAPLNRKVYDTKNAAAAGFYQQTSRFYGTSPNWLDYPEIAKGTKLKDQSTFRVIALVAQ